VSERVAAALRAQGESARTGRWAKQAA